MTEIVALTVARDIDLSNFVTYLRRSGVPFRIYEDGPSQVIAVFDEVHRDLVQNWYEREQAGALPEIGDNQARTTLNWRAWLRAPLTLTLIMATLICFPVTSGLDDGRPGEWFRLLSFLDFQVIADRLYFANLAYTLESGQWWRLWSPMFLHFGWLHLAFNLLWIWEVGRRIEIQVGPGWLALIVLLASLVANLGQYWLSGAGFFGGMSGVVFGLLGFGWVLHRFMPARDLGLPVGVYVFMAIYLCVGFTGAIDLVGLGQIANGAHLGGLLGGLLVGALSWMWHRRARRSHKR